MAVPERVDTITAEVIRSGLETVALEMRTACMRTAYSPIVAMGGDLSVSSATATAGSSRRARTSRPSSARCPTRSS